jgi:hypothetical protein
MVLTGEMVRSDRYLRADLATAVPPLPRALALASRTRPIGGSRQYGGHRRAARAAWTKRGILHYRRDFAGSLRRAVARRVYSNLRNYVANTPKSSAGAGPCEAASGLAGLRGHRGVGAYIAQRPYSRRQRVAIVFDDVVEFAEKCRGFLVGQFNVHVSGGNLLSPIDPWPSPRRSSAIACWKPRRVRRRQVLRHDP